MQFKKRIPKKFFHENGHYLGKPAEFNERIIRRRINLLEQYPDFVGKEYSLLDVGCGNGASLFQLSDKMKICTGVDINPDHKKVFSEHMIKHNIKNCDFKVLDVTQKSLGEKFDRLISFEVIEHLSEEQGLEFYSSSLKGGGLMAVSVPNKWWLFETHGARLPILAWNRVPFFSWLPKPIHDKYSNARIYTKKSIASLLKKYGFEILQSVYVMAPIDVLPQGKLKKFLIKYIFNSDETRIPFKATSILIFAQKHSNKNLT